MSESPVRYSTPSVRWRWMLATASTSAAYPALHGPFEPVQGPDTGFDQFTIKKPESSLLQMGFFTLDGESGTFRVRITGVSQLEGGEWVASPIAELECTASGDTDDLPDITGNRPVAQSHAGVESITKVSGPDSMEIINGANLATVTLDAGPHQYIAVDFKRTSGTPSMNGAFRLF